MQCQIKCMLKYTEQRRLALLLYFRTIVSDDSMAPCRQLGRNQKKRQFIFEKRIGDVQRA
jgi:hypothetical protein